MPKKVRFADHSITRKGTQYSRSKNTFYTTYSSDEYPDRGSVYEIYPAPKGYDIDDLDTRINTLINRNGF